MSLIPSKPELPSTQGSAAVMQTPFAKKDHKRFENYGSTAAERELLVVGKPNLLPGTVEHQLAELIYALFAEQHHYSHHHPRTNPKLPPEPRFKRHRNYYIYQLNEFRHWWKTSRLLLRVAGAIVFMNVAENWTQMAVLNVSRRRDAKQAFKFSKHMGQGGPVKPFFDWVQPFTRTIRLVLAAARAWEAKVDNRLYEVGLAEAFAFMGNRCSRHWARDFAERLTTMVALPFSGTFLAPYLEQNSRPVIIAMGLLRAILPFAASFQGSRLGRQLTFNTYKYANYRWHSVQNIMHFHEKAGVYQDTDLDPELLALARQVAEAIGHGLDPSETRQKLGGLGFRVFGSGCGGYAVYRIKEQDKIILLHVTPYGPSILDEMPRYILLERRPRFYASRLRETTDATIFDAATPREARVDGFTYSGAYFQSQEWAALRQRFDRELEDYSNACRSMGTERVSLRKRSSQYTKNAAPPTDLNSLKAFIRSGRMPHKERRDKGRWKQIQKQVKRIATLVAKHQKNQTAPTSVILYLEGLDCAGKSSTGMLICDALEHCGYTVRVAQHNRPPTPAQKAHPWMHRVRFEYPEDMYQGDEKVPPYSALVWDRGPAGDFVYGSYRHLPPEAKLQKYEEFRTYDYQCREDGVLFCKIFFVADRDSIAATLGKRLAHKKIARDLHTWLDANSVEHFREELQAIEMHIDPSDFVAFNKYEENLSLFSEFVRNTDYVGHVGHQQDTSIGYNNPWLVVNTSYRHGARLNIMQAFYTQLNRFATTPAKRVFAYDELAEFFGGEVKDKAAATTKTIPRNIVEQKERGISIRAVVQSFLLLLLLYEYAHKSWKFDIDDVM